jgi:hypothetical protein
MKVRRPALTYVFSAVAWRVWLFLTLITVCNLEWQFVRLGSSWLDVRIMDLYHFLCVPRFVLEAASACFVIDVIFKWFGYSSSGKLVEILGPTGTQSATTVGKSDILELPCAKPIALYTASCLGLFCLATAAAPIFVLMGGGRDGAACLWGMAPLAVLAGLCLWSFRRAYLVRVDPWGLSGPPCWPPFRRKYVPWSEVETCDIVTLCTTFGRTNLSVPVLRDRFGRKLLCLGMFLLTPADQISLLTYIESKLRPGCRT